MGKEFVPIMDLMPTKANRQWPIELLDILEEHQRGDDYTYTTRFDIQEKDWPQVKEKLTARAKELDVDVSDLIKLFEENDRDVSFLVDCW